MFHFIVVVLINVKMLYVFCCLDFRHVACIEKMSYRRQKFGEWSWCFLFNGVAGKYQTCSKYTINQEIPRNIHKRLQVSPLYNISVLLKEFLFLYCNLM